MVRSVTPPPVKTYRNYWPNPSLTQPKPGIPVNNPVLPPKPIGGANAM